VSPCLGGENVLPSYAESSHLWL